MNIELQETEKKDLRQHLVIVTALLLLLIGPLFGPITTFLGDQFEIETAVFFLLLSFIVAFTIILAIIFRFKENREFSWREQLSRLGWGRPSRLSANIVGALVGLAWGVTCTPPPEYFELVCLAWGALSLTSILQFQPDTAIAAISPFRLVAVVLAVVGTIMEDLITRGYMMNGLKQLKVPAWGQLFLSALLFALYHALWSFNIISFIFSLLYGLILSGLFLWGKRSLTPVILAHALAVLISEPFSSMLIFLAPGG